MLEQDGLGKRPIEAFLSISMFTVMGATKIEKQIINNREAFLVYNENRKNRTLELISREKKDVLICLPFILHTNHPDFPGYVESPNTPHGIYNFNIQDTVFKKLRTLLPKSIILKKDIIKKSYPEIIPPRLSIESLLLMGSVGSIAHTVDSDYDYWVCIDMKNFTPETLKLLDKKLTLIKNWIFSHYKMEVTFFIMDVARARADNFGRVDKESAGSSEGKLLKEEFYRTLILQAGKIPLWWITPVGATDEEYEIYKETVKSSRKLNCSDFIDLGNVYSISSAEFFGAALWQINKAMLSPFKSVLKMALLERFLGKSKRYDLLSNTIKKRVHEYCNNTKMLDPYAVMFDSIVEYNQQKGREADVTLLKKCFYIKTGVKLERSACFMEKMNYKEKIMMDYIDEWRWSDDLIKELNMYKEWNFNAVSKLGRQVHKFLRETYIRLSDKLKTDEDIKHKITDIDRTILGRKLFTIYSKHPNKVIFLERAFDEGIWQERLTFYAGFVRSGNLMWRLYRGQLSRESVSSPASENMLIKSAKNILDILIWIIYNRIYDERTSFYLIPNPTPVSLADIQKLVTELRQFFPPMDISLLDNKALQENPKKIKFFMVVNFSAASANDIEELTLFYKTSWGELFFEHFDSPEGVQNILDYMLEDSPRGVSEFSDYYRIFIPKSTSFNKMFLKLNNKIKGELKKASYRY